MTLQSIGISSDAYVKLRNKGFIIDDIDLLIAGIAISNDLILVTNNEKHFNRIENLVVSNWEKIKIY